MWLCSTVARPASGRCCGGAVAIARYEAASDGLTAEVAVAVDPAWRHVGLATALVKLLAEAAVRNGIRHFTVEFFSDNVDVGDLASESGLPYNRTQDWTGVVSVDVSLPGSDASLEHT